MRGRITQLQVSSFLSAFFPQLPKDVPWVYHVSRTQTSHTHVTSVILSITPTQGVYEAMNDSDVPLIVFLHRPFDLDRKRVRKGIEVFACHKGFDEVLTVGVNPVLAQRLHMVVNESQPRIIVGYKNDPTRRIGYVGALEHPLNSHELMTVVHNEFGDHVGMIRSEHVTGHTFKYLALMNAFSLATIDQVLACNPRGSETMYITGEARQEGLDAAAAVGMGVLTLGHREVEEWGIRYLAQELKREFGEHLEVVTIMEDEEPKLKKGQVFTEALETSC